MLDALLVFLTRPGDTLVTGRDAADAWKWASLACCEPAHANPEADPVRLGGAPGASQLAYPRRADVPGSGRGVAIIAAIDAVLAASVHALFVAPTLVPATIDTPITAVLGRVC